MDTQLTKHFTLSEFERSETARRLGIENRVPEELVPALKNLCEEVLEPLRVHLGRAVRISSGYRCEALNKAVGGVDNSQHRTGEAADLVIRSAAEGVEWALWIQDHTNFDQLLLERKGKSVWVHVSCRLDSSRNRRMVRRMVVK